MIKLQIGGHLREDEGFPMTKIIIKVTIIIMQIKMRKMSMSMILDTIFIKAITTIIVKPRVNFIK
jgi:hypothetical protein